MSLRGWGGTPGERELRSPREREPGGALEGGKEMGRRSKANGEGELDRKGMTMGEEGHPWEKIGKRMGIILLVHIY